MTGYVILSHTYFFPRHQDWSEQDIQSVELALNDPTFIDFLAVHMGQEAMASLHLELYLEVCIAGKEATRRMLDVSL